MKKLAQLTYKYRKSVLALWLVIVIALGYFALKLPSVLSGSGFKYDGTFSEVEK